MANPAITKTLGALEIAVSADFEQWKKDRKTAKKEAKRMGEEAAGALHESWKTGLGKTEEETTNVFKRMGRRIRKIWDTMVASTLEKGAVATIAAAKAMRILSERTRDAEGELSKFGKTAGLAADALDVMASTMIKTAEAALKARLAVIATGAAIATAAVVARAKFQPEWNRVITLLGSTSQDVIDELDVKLNRMAATLGVDIPEATQAFYNILSAMPQLVKQPERALGILNAALQVSATGFGDASTAGKAITTVLNAFQLEAEQATMVADALFATQDQGVTTFGELAEEIGRVADITANLEGSFEDVLAVVATVTPKGQETNQVLTNLRSLMVSIIGASPEMRQRAQELGIELSAQAIATEGLVGWLTKLIDVTGGDLDVIAQFITSQEGLALVASLSKETETLAEKLEIISTAAGKTAENVDTMNQSFSRQKEIFFGLIGSQLRRLGKPLEEGLARGLAAVNEGLEQTIDLVELMAEAPRPMQIQIQDAEEYGGVVGWLIGRLQELNSLPPFLQSPHVPPAGFQSLQHGVTSRLPGFSDRRADVSGIQLGKIRFDRLKGTTPDAPPIPLTAEASSEAIKELQQLKELEALLHFQRTGNHEEYREMLRQAKEASNELLLAHLEEFQEAGAAQEELVALAQLYQDLARDAQAAAEAERARASLTQTTGLFGKAEEFVAASPTLTSVDQVPDDLLAKMQQLLRLEQQIAEVEENMALLGPGDSELRAQSQRFLDDITGSAAALRDEIAGLAVDLMAASEPLIELATIGSTQFGATVIDQVADQARRIGPALKEVADARRELAVLELDSTSTTDELTAAREKLATAEENARKKTTGLIKTNKSLGISQKQLNALVDLFIQALADAGVEIKGLNAEADKFGEKADIVASIAKGLLSAADAAGVLTDQMRLLLRGTIDVAEGAKGINLAITALRAGTGDPLALLGAGIQLGGGLFSVIKGITGSGADGALVESQAKLIRATNRLADIMLDDISGRELTDLRRVLFGVDVTKVNQEITDPKELAALQELEEISDIDFLDGNKISDLNAFFAAMEFFFTTSLSTFEDNVGGVMDAMAFKTAQLGDRAGTAAEQMDELIDKLIEQGDASEFSKKLRQKLEAEGVEGAHAFLDELVLRLTERDQDLFKPGGLFFDLKPGEAEALIEGFREVLERMGTEGPEGTTSSFQVIRTITETTAGVFISEMMTNRFWNERGALANEAILAIMQNGGPLLPETEAVGAPAFTGGIGTVNLTVEFSGPLVELNTTGGVDQDEVVATARRAGTAAAEQIDTVLKQNFVEHVRSIGR